MSSSGSADRVVIDPDDLQRVAARMRGGAEVLSSTGRHLATRPRPDMPSGLASRVADLVQEANRELQELALELVEEAGQLMARATAARLGGIDSVAWLMPGLRGVLPVPDLRAATLSSSGALLEDGPGPGQRWAEAALDEMAVPAELSDETGIDLRAFAELLDDVSHLEVPPGSVLSGLSLLTTFDAQPESGTARGALGVAFAGAELGPTGIGLIGCLLAGAGGSADAAADL